MMPRPRQAPVKPPSFDDILKSPPPADDLVRLPPGLGDEQLLPGFSMEDADDVPIEGEIIPPPGGSERGEAPAEPQAGPLRYEQRIRVLDAWQYRGQLAGAPVWVDRNWAAYADLDPLRGIPAGPALRVPAHGGFAFCRPGDYMVHQEVLLAHGLPPIEAIEVWSRESFEKAFIPSERSVAPADAQAT